MNEPDMKVVDLTSIQTVEENVTLKDSGSQDGQNTPDPDIGTQDDPANDHRLSTVKPEKEYPVETKIEYLFNPNNKKVFSVNKDIVRQKGLIPCTKEGKILPDTRRPSDFR